MHRDLAEKLRLTAAALGCATRKDLCAQFRRANPASQVDPDRLGKWMQGRAAPRDSSVYADWARLIGTARSAAWMRSCSPEELRAELARTLNLEASALPLAEPGLGGPGAHLVGAYACYSPAWSPYFAGRVIRGSLSLTPGRRRTIMAAYSETLLGRRVSFTGAPTIGGSIHLPLTEEGSGLPVYLALYLPPPPASVLAGIIAGTTMVGPECRPSAGRLIALRVPDKAALARSDRYLAAGESIADDLVALGLPPASARAAGAITERLLTEPGSAAFGQVPLSAQTALAAELDPVWLGCPVAADGT
ncbi:hypothetical protein [Falsiroseomonas oryziterrae]|uniref:hypothetical protein n=1 Tax=Falsiroseomonas oryziterrae TaxID=2911368 RepID=UPI001F3ACB7C|nr:hypothetical protein [Roseomonas sp. NPKOSM-4]